MFWLHLTNNTQAGIALRHKQSHLVSKIWTSIVGSAKTGRKRFVCVTMLSNNASGWVYLSISFSGRSIYLLEIITEKKITDFWQAALNYINTCHSDNMGFFVAYFLRSFHMHVFSYFLKETCCLKGNDFLV